MRAIRELPLAAPLILVGSALFFGGGEGAGSLPWLGGAALLTLLALLATRGLPGGALALLPLAALTAWLALTIDWSTMPDRSWEYANRTLVYLLFAALGLWFAGRRRELALGLALLLGAVVVWSLAGKVFPPLYDYGPPGVTRLRAPVGLWNELALLGDFALPLALWRRRLAGTLLAYAWLVALFLTYSRGGLLTAVLVVAAWIAFTDERLESVATLLAAALPAAVVVAIAFALPGVTKDGQSTHVRWHDGLIFGAVLLAGTAAAGALQRLPRPRVTPAVRRAVFALLVVAAVAVGVVAVVKGGGSAPIGNSGARLTSTSSNFRFVWWKQALHGWQHHPLGGTGAGSFHLTNLRYRHNYLDYTTEPHNVPLQFLSEAGLVGLALFVIAAAAFLRNVRRTGVELALSLIFVAYLAHSIVDVDWDFVAVSAPAFISAGALAARRSFRTVPGFAMVAAAGAALAVFGTLLLPWLGARWSDDATAATSPARAITLAKRARSVDPLLVDPLWALAFANENRPRVALGYYDQATRVQPSNPQTWLLAGRFALVNDCPRLAYSYLLRYTELDPRGRASEGGDDYRRALALVNSGKPRC